MTPNQRFWLAVLCVGAAFALVLSGKTEAGVAFLTLIGGSPLAHGMQGLPGIMGAAADTSSTSGTSGTDKQTRQETGETGNEGA